MKKMLFFLCILSVGLFARDTLEFKISGTDDIGILMLFNKANYFEQLSGTSYYGKSYDSVDLTNYLNEGENYLIFFLYNLPYGRNSCNSGKWRLNFTLLENSRKIVSKYENVRDNHYGCRNNYQTVGIKRIYVYRVYKSQNGNISVYKQDINDTLFLDMLNGYNNYYRNLYLKNEHYPNYQENQGVDFNLLLFKYINKYYMKYRDYITKDKIIDIFSKNIFNSNENSLRLSLYNEMTNIIKINFKSKNLKQLKLIKNISFDYNQMRYLNKVLSSLKKELSKKFIKNLHKRDFKKAKHIIALGLDKTIWGANTKTIYNKIKKLYKLEKKYRVHINIDLKNLNLTSTIIKDDFTIGRFKKNSNRFIASCSYGEKTFKTSFLKASKYIILQCKKEKIYCPKSTNKKNCLYIKNYKINGYIKAMQKDIKKHDYLWSSYTKENILLDEYDTFKDEANILKLYHRKGKNVTDKR